MGIVGEIGAVALERQPGALGVADPQGDGPDLSSRSAVEYQGARPEPVDGLDEAEPGSAEDLGLGHTQDPAERRAGEGHEPVGVQHGDAVEGVGHEGSEPALGRPEESGSVGGVGVRRGAVIAGRAGFQPMLRVPSHEPRFPLRLSSPLPTPPGIDRFRPRLE
jgi:hypothetical protein